MAKQLQLRRGTTVQNDAFTGALGELTMDTEKKELRIHDGSTQGGVKVPTSATADYVVAFQAPDPNNDYKWYRKYKSGWCEFGFRATWSGAWTTFSLPLTMADANYTCTAGGYRTDSSPYQQMTCFKNYTTTTVDIWSSDDTTANTAEVRVYGCGMAA